MGFENVTFPTQVSFHQLMMLRHCWTGVRGVRQSVWRTKTAEGNRQLCSEESSAVQRRGASLGNDLERKRIPD